MIESFHQSGRLHRIQQGRYIGPVTHSEPNSAEKVFRKDVLTRKNSVSEPLNTSVEKFAIALCGLSVRELADRIELVGLDRVRNGVRIQ